MQVEEELGGLSPEKDMLLTVGVFDGVHLGHRHLISQLTKLAKQQSLLSAVVTFRKHPQEVLSPRTKLPFLTNLTMRTNLLKNEGVDAVIILSFTHGLARRSARQFASLLKKYLRMRGLVIGPDFTLGQDREGDRSTLHSLGQDIGFSLTVIPPIMINGEIVSSTAIRKALADGNMEKVNSLLGRYYSLYGQVIPGVGRGITLGFPTANLDIAPQQALPPDGIYATWAYVGGEAYPSMTNIGKRPTFSGSERTVEVYVLDYYKNLYGQELKIDIVERLRDEIRFATAEELKKQITEDVKQGRAILNSRGSK
ncbi:bifunctional riboflavin kinase/FAD synthetase [Candidatus Omnitrophota bacterium]